MKKVCDILEKVNCVSGMENSSLEIYGLSSRLEISEYNKLLYAINSTNPFYRSEILINPKKSQENLRYFVFKIDNCVKALMVFYLRSIESDYQKTYFDVISPYSYSGPIFVQNIILDEIEKFWQSVDSWYKENKIITEFIRFSLNQNFVGYSGHVLETLKNVKGRILPEELQWERFDKKVRNNIRKALSYNLKFELRYGHICKCTISEFHRIYLSTMKRKDAAHRYFYSLDYFENLISNNSDCCAIALIFYKNKVVSTELLLLSDKTIYSYLGGTDSDYFFTRPNDFLKYQVLDWARKKGFMFYVLGGGQQDNDSLYKYKKSFFPYDDDVIFYTGRKVINEKVYIALLKENGFQTKDLNSNIDHDFFPKYRISS